MSTRSAGPLRPDHPWTRHYSPGVPADLKLPKAPLSTSWTRPSALRQEDRAGILRRAHQLPRTWRFHQQSRRGPEGARVRAGDRVALVLPKLPQHIIAFHAALAWRRRRRTQILTIQTASFAISSRTTARPSPSAGTRPSTRSVKLPADVGLESIVSVGLMPAMPLLAAMALRLPVPAARAARAALAAGKGTRPGQGASRTADRAGVEELSCRRRRRRDPRPAAGDLAVRIQYHQRTTGRPKGAVLTHANLQANAAQGRAWVPGSRTGRETVYAVLPMFHAYGLTLCMTFALSIGARLVLFPRFDVDLAAEGAQEVAATFPPASADLRPDRRSSRRARYRAGQHPGFHLGGDEPADGDSGDVGEGDRGLPDRGLRADGNLAHRPGQPLRPSRKPGTVGVPFPPDGHSRGGPAERSPGPRPRRGGRAPDPGPAGLCRLLEPAEGDRGSAAGRRLVPHG